MSGHRRGAPSSTPIDPTTKFGYAVFGPPMVGVKARAARRACSKAASRTAKARQVDVLLCRACFVSCFGARRRFGRGLGAGCRLARLWCRRGLHLKREGGGGL